MNAIIIGGGPAGSIAAILLARNAWQVTLVEQHRFPRDKVCGECLSPVGIDVLNRLNLIDRSSNPRPVELTRATLHPTDGPAITLQLPRPMWGLSRRVMDDRLLTSARQAGAVVRQPARCEAIIPGDRPAVRLRNLETNRIERLQADHLIVADGKGAFPGSRPPATGEFGVQAHFRLNGPHNAIELFGCNGHYCGISPLEDGTSNLAATIPRSRLRGARGDLDRVLLSILTENPALAHRLRHARLVRPWLTTPLPRFDVQTQWPRNIIPIGNAAAAVEPIGGEGMGLAMRSAELAAHALLTGNLNTLPRQFHRLWTRRAIASRLAGITASIPTMASAVATLLAHNYPLQYSATYLLGKGGNEELLH